jgi:hypothetical protein
LGGRITVREKPEKGLRTDFSELTKLSRNIRYQMSITPEMK